MNESQNLNTINEIRSKLDIVDVISGYVPLTQKGKNFFGVCPFHDDTNPSMSVSREKQIYRCFSCGATGNVFGFVQDYEHISFKEALNLLATKAGVELKGFQIRKKDDKYDKFYDIYEISHKYFLNNLKTNLGKNAREYLENRQITEEMIKEFGIGLSLDTSKDLVSLLTKKGYDLNTLNQIGLANFDKDLFNNRIMFPLKDLTGRVVAFSGRRYDGIKENKYVNTKGTVIFQKGNLLYNYFDARESVRKKNQVIVMEGFMAAIRSITIGVTNVVSLMGTAMTKEQRDLIKRMSNEVIVCFDGDDAGFKATLTNGEELESIGCSVKVIELEDNLDPDDYILKYGEDAFKSLIKNAIPFSDFRIKSLKKGINLNSDEKKADYINNVILETSKIKDEIRRELILKTLAKEFDIGYNTLEKRLLTLLEKSEPKLEPIIINKKTKKRDKYEMASKTLLYYMLVNNQARNLFENGEINFPNEEERFLASEIIYYYKIYGNIIIADFYTYLKDKPSLLGVLNEALDLELEDNINEKVILDYVKVLKENSVNLEIQRLTKLMMEKNDPLEQAKIAEKIRKLKMGS
ncbi:MAG: DNA primase [Firmicutes bacterium]|nr:DNA primase [Bacillota bacterium]